MGMGIMVAACGGPPRPAELHIIPTLHGLHATNSNYSYDSLRAIVERIGPDIVAVEVRPADIGRDTAYLGRNYPLEMWKAPDWFPEARVVGIDWLGDDLDDGPIPDDHWTEKAAITRYRRALREDTVAAARLSACDTFMEQRAPLLRTKSLPDLLDSDDAGLTLRYYACLEEQLAGTPHARVPAFYRERNERMYALVQALVAGNPGKRIVVLTGDDHYAQFDLWRRENDPAPGR